MALRPTCGKLIGGDVAKAFNESMLRNMSLDEKANYGLTVPAEAVGEQQWAIEEAGNEAYQEGWSQCMFSVMGALEQMGDKRRKPGVLARWLRRNVEMD